MSCVWCVAPLTLLFLGSVKLLLLWLVILSASVKCLPLACSPVSVMRSELMAPLFSLVWFLRFLIGVAGTWLLMMPMILLTVFDLHRSAVGFPRILTRLVRKGLTLSVRLMSIAEMLSAVRFLESIRMCGFLRLWTTGCLMLGLKQEDRILGTWVMALLRAVVCRLLSVVLVRIVVGLTSLVLGLARGPVAMMTLLSGCLRSCGFGVAARVPERPVVAVRVMVTVRVRGCGARMGPVDWSGK